MLPYTIIVYTGLPADYTTYIHIVWPNRSTVAGAAYLMTMYEDNSNYDITQFVGSNIKTDITTGAALKVASTIQESPTFNTEYRIAKSVTEDDYAASSNGGVVSTDTSCTIPSGFITMKIANWNASSPFGGHMKHVALWTTAMSDTDIQTITTG